MFTFDYLIKRIPNFFSFFFDNLFCVLHVVRHLLFDKFTDNKRTEENESKSLWKSTLIHLEFWSYDDYGTSRVVYSLSEKVLTETSLFPLEYIRERFEFLLGCARVPWSVRSNISGNEHIYRFLKHTLLVLEDNLRSSEFYELSKTVVSVDNTSVEIIEIA